MKILNIVFVIIVVLTIHPAAAQDTNCPTEEQRIEFNDLLKTAETVEDFQILANQIQLAVSGCNAAQPGTGDKRSNPAPVNTRVTINERRDIEIIGWSNVTEQLSDEVANGEEIIAVYFVHYCTLSV